MKKFVSILFLLTSLLLGAELSLSPLMHNHDDAAEHKDCPAYILVSQQLSDSGEFYAEINLFKPDSHFALPEQKSEKHFSLTLQNKRNKAPPFA